MRVSAEVKAQTRQALLDHALQGLADPGGEAEFTTRALARRVGVAHGTIFNYFPSREALLIAALAPLFRRAHQEFLDDRTAFESLEEALFAITASIFRHLAQVRASVGPVADAALSPMVRGGLTDEAEAVRTEHLELVSEVVRRFHPETEVTAVSSYLYWTLHLGVLTWWSADESPKQQDALVVLDQATRLFARALTDTQPETERHHVS